MLGLFNLLPGAPLDGGRVLRAYLWRRYGDPVRAGVGAARVGRVLAFVLIALGLGEFLAGATVGGVWLVFLGWFIFAASREEEAQVRTQHAFDTVRVADVMTAHPHTAPPVTSPWRSSLRGTCWETATRPTRSPIATGRSSADQPVGVASHRTGPAYRDVGARSGDATVRGDHDHAGRIGHGAAAAPGSEVRTPRLVVDSVGSGGVVGIVTASDLTRLIEVYQLAGAGQLG